MIVLPVARRVREYNECHDPKTGEFCSEDSVTVRAYHGTPKAFERFADEMLGTNTGARTALLGHFFTDTPTTAARFAGEGSMRRPTISLRKPFELSPSYKAKVVDEGFPYPRRVMRVWDRTMDPFTQLHDIITKSSKRGSWRDVTTDDVRAFKARLQKVGYDGIVLKDTAMDAGTALIGAPMPVNTLYIVFKADSIHEANLREHNDCHDKQTGQFCSDPTGLPEGVSLTVKTDKKFLEDYSYGHATTAVAILSLRKQGQEEGAGHLALFPPSSHSHPEYLVVSYVSINRNLRGQGAGSVLYREAVKVAKQLGFKGVQAGGRNSISQAYWDRWLATGKAKKAVHYDPLTHEKTSHDVRERRVREYNQCHDPETGKFCGKGFVSRGIVAYSGRGLGQTGQAAAEWDGDCQGGPVGL